MLKGLERRYTLEQIEAQHEDKIRPRLNYDALTTLRNPLYVKFGQQVQDASKDQHDARMTHMQTQQTINNIANNNGVNAAELEHILQNLMGAFSREPQTQKQTPPTSDHTEDEYIFRDHRNDGDGPDGGGGGGADPNTTVRTTIQRPAPYDRAARYPGEARVGPAPLPSFGRLQRCHERYAREHSSHAK